MELYASVYDNITILQKKHLQKAIDSIPVPPSIRGGEILPQREVGASIVEWDQLTKIYNLSSLLSKQAATPLYDIKANLDIKRAYLGYTSEMCDLDQLVGNEINEERLGGTVYNRLVDLRGAIERRIEAMRWDALLDGAFSYTLPDGNSISFSVGIPAGNLITNADTATDQYWTDTTNSTPLNDFIGVIEQLGDNYSVFPAAAWLNSTTYDYLEKSAQIQNLYLSTDFKRATERHYITRLRGIDLVEYDGWYNTSVGGSPTKYLPDGYVVFVPPMIDGVDPAYVAMGPVKTADGALRSGIVSDRFVQANPVVEFLRTSAAPLPIFQYPEAFGCLKVY